jgi:hypothetical protein
MKKNLFVLGFLIVGFTAATARAQFGGPPAAPSLDGAMAKLFGNNSGFSATVEFHTSKPAGAGAGREMNMTGKMAHLDDKSRFEMDLASANLPPQAVQHMKQMGMTKVVELTRHDHSQKIMLYPDLNAYVVMQIPGTNAPVSEYKSETSKLGEETIDGHACIKNKVVVTGPNEFMKESTVWNALDLKEFPIKIETTDKQGQEVVMLFKDVKLEKPAAALFDPPANFTKYDDMMSLMRSRMQAPPR